MAGNSNASASASASASAAATFDNLLIQSMMSRLQLRPPYLDTNSFLSQSLDDFILEDHLSKDPSDDDDDADDELYSLYGADNCRRRLLAKEEAKLEKDIIRIIHSAGAHEALNANSGQSVTIGDHNVCISFHEEPSSEYRAWEWHGHIMLFDDENGYSAEYIYGNYFERLPDKKKMEVKGDDEEDKDGSEDEETKVKTVQKLGLRDLIGDSKDPVGGVGARVLHRNSLNAGSSVTR